ncbi:hydroxymethylbilane synthase [Caballeronia sp. HLA56]
MKKITIATRESRLALWQADYVRARLVSLGWNVELLGITTRGDKILDRTLSKVGGKALFIKELEAALTEGRADLAVHSLKDVPMEFPEGFELACVTQRDDPRDALISNYFGSLDDLPGGARVGTSSLRREVLLRALRPDLKIVPLRGNVETRLRNLDHEDYDAIVLAAVGLQRLGLHHRIREIFSTERMLPPGGQGALAVEIRSDRADLRNALAPLSDRQSWICATAERAVNQALGGNCSMPLAAHAQWAGRTLSLEAAWGDATVQPVKLIRAHQTVFDPDFTAADALGGDVARRLLASGARRFV